MDDEERVVKNLMHLLTRNEAKLLTWACKYVRIGLDSVCKAKSWMAICDSIRGDSQCKLDPILHMIVLHTSRTVVKNNKLAYNLSIRYKHSDSDVLSNVQNNPDTYKNKYGGALVAYVREQLNKWLLYCVRQDDMPRMWSRIMRTVPDPSIVLKRVLAYAEWYDRMRLKYRTQPTLKALKKQRVAEIIPSWTGNIFNIVQMQRTLRSEAMNRPMNRQRTLTGDKWLVREARLVEHALMQHMRYIAPRAPQKPQDFYHTECLYRGMTLTRNQEMELVRTGRLASTTFMSFSTDKSVAIKFTRTDRARKVVFILPVEYVEPYTPWVWFMTHETNGIQKVYQQRRRGVQRTLIKDEHEVLLPPGTLYVYRTLPMTRASPTCYYVKYTPLDKWRPRKIGIAGGRNPRPSLLSRFGKLFAPRTR